MIAFAGGLLALMVVWWVLRRLLAVVLTHVMLAISGLWVSGDTSLSDR